jgi:malate dehydrogenase (oxaloacetate-decarboxylating)
MIAQGALALGKMSPALEDESKGLLPDIWDVRKMSVQVAAAVMRQAAKDGDALVKLEDDIEAQVERGMWEPTYLPISPKR